MDALPTARLSRLRSLLGGPRLAESERRAYSAALLEVTADAPTLCEGWTAHDLAAHSWSREHDPRALPGIASPALAHLAEASMARVKASWPYEELARRLADTPRTPVTLLKPLDDAVNATEFFIHTEDVRRANGLPRRPVSAELQDALWRRLPLLTRLLLGKVDLGVQVERAGTDESFRAKPGASIVTVVGQPSEIVLFIFGRQRVADVQLIGLPGDCESLRRAKLGA